MRAFVSMTMTFLIVTSVCCALPCAAVAQASDHVTVIDEQNVRHNLSTQDLAKLKRTSVKVAGTGNESIQYDGVLLADILTHCGVVLGKDLRGARVANYVLLTAQDGYRVVLALAELDPATTGKVVLLADSREGKPLGEKEHSALSSPMRNVRCAGSA
jgi:hypothetical protein